jgi:23S rRNA pseudouridine1911/1915/1917 synthase
LNAKQRVKHLSLCAPDALDDDSDAFERCGDSDIIRQSVLRRHGARSRVYEVCAARFGWDASAGSKEPSARRVSRALGVPFDIVVRTIRTEVKETPMGLGVSARALEELEILYEDEERGTVAVNKLAGVASTPQNRISDESMASRVVAYWTRKYHNNVPLSSTTPFVVHRLDYETSGVFVVAKTKEAARVMQSAFEGRRVRKTYLALCKRTTTNANQQQQQHQQQQQQGTIDYPLVKDAAADFAGRAKVRCVLNDDEAALVKVMPAETDWRILHRNGSYALIEARPRTGRTHQIRAHLAAVGWPIVGDDAYGYRDDGQDDDSLISRHALHAHTLTFLKSTTTEGIPPVSIVAPPPRDFTRACAAVGVVGIETK